MITPAIEVLIEAFKNDKAPCEWIKYSYSSTTSFAIHIKNFQEHYLWLQNFANNNFSVQNIRLGAFRNPTSILIAIKSIFSHENNIPLDLVTFDHFTISENK